MSRPVDPDDDARRIFGNWLQEFVYAVETKDLDAMATVADELRRLHAEAVSAASS